MGTDDQAAHLDDSTAPIVIMRGTTFGQLEIGEAFFIPYHNGIGWIQPMDGTPALPQILVKAAHDCYHSLAEKGMTTCFDPNLVVVRVRVPLSTLGRIGW
jgi:hypothetical protein